MTRPRASLVSLSDTPWYHVVTHTHTHTKEKDTHLPFGGRGRGL